MPNYQDKVKLLRINGSMLVNETNMGLHAHKVTDEEEANEVKRDERLR